MKAVIIKSRKDRRSGQDRRQFSYTVHIPERRKNNDRRSGRDRRKNPERQNSIIDKLDHLWPDFGEI